MRFVDTNIFIYATSAHPEFGSVSREILQRIENGESAVTSVLVLCELAWVLEARGKQAQINDLYEIVLSYDSLKVLDITLDDLMVASTYVIKHGIDFNDAVNLSIMERENVSEVYSNDKKHFGKITSMTLVFE
jgi:predicted nucleic acid-binding protein